ncbi:MAG: amidohydrolase family protein [Segetibacter sp.]|nr:amidohydrolase family protein [Segetibacter sp.]
MIIATKAIVAKGTYGPRWESPDVELPQGAAEVAGIEDIAGEVRTQIGKVLMPLKYTQTTARDRFGAGCGRSYFTLSRLEERS